MKRKLGILLLVFVTTNVAAQDVAKVDPQHYHVIFENSHIRVIEGRDKPGDKTPMHYHPAHLSYVDGLVTAKIVLQNGQTIVDGPSDKLWCSPPTTHSTENVGTTNTHEVLVEFKDFNPCDDSASGPQADSSAKMGIDTTKGTETSSPVSAADRVVESEKTLWAAEKKKDKAGFDSLLADEYAEITADDGRLDKAAVLASFDHNGLQDYSLGPMRTTQVSPGVVLLTYEFRVKEMHEKMHEGKFVGSSLWVNHSGKWVNVFFQETPKP